MHGSINVKNILTRQLLHVAGLTGPSSGSKLANNHLTFVYLQHAVEQSLNSSMHDLLQMDAWRTACWF
jgi:hypothetical protein